MLQPEDGVWPPVLGVDGVSVLTDGEGGDALHLLTRYKGPPGPSPVPGRSTGSCCEGLSLRTRSAPHLGSCL